MKTWEIMEAIPTIFNRLKLQECLATTSMATVCWNHTWIPMDTTCMVYGGVLLIMVNSDYIRRMVGHGIFNGISAYLLEIYVPQKPISIKYKPILDDFGVITYTKQTPKNYAEKFPKPGTWGENITRTSILNGPKKLVVHRPMMNLQGSQKGWLELPAPWFSMSGIPWWSPCLGLVRWIAQVDVQISRNHPSFNQLSLSEWTFFSSAPGVPMDSLKHSYAPFGSGWLWPSDTRKISWVHTVKALYKF